MWVAYIGQKGYILQIVCCSLKYTVGVRKTIGKIYSAIPFIAVEIHQERDGVETVHAVACLWRVTMTVLLHNVGIRYYTIHRGTDVHISQMPVLAYLVNSPPPTFDLPGNLGRPPNMLSTKIAKKATSAKIIKPSGSAASPTSSPTTNDKEKKNDNAVVVVTSTPSNTILEGSERKGGENAVPGSMRRYTKADMLALKESPLSQELPKDLVKTDLYIFGSDPQRSGGDGGGGGGGTTLIYDI